MIMISSKINVIILKMQHATVFFSVFSISVPFTDLHLIVAVSHVSDYAATLG